MGNLNLTAATMRRFSTFFVGVVIIYQLLAWQSVEARWKPSYLKRSDIDSFKSEELIGEILNDVEDILNEWRITGGPRNSEALWLKSVLENVRHRRGIPMKK